MLTENIGENPLEMENNNTEELLKINYSDYFHKDNEAKENDGVDDGNIEVSGAETGHELSFLNSEPQDVSTPVLQKRGRGRPPKKTRSLPVKRERVEREYSMLALDTSFQDADDMVNRTAPPIVLKLKLGVKEESEKDEGMVLNQTEPNMKRGRGRPRKIKSSPQEKTFIEEYSHDISYTTDENSYYRPRKPAYLPETADNDLENDSSQLQNKQNSNISEVKTRLRGRPKTNYLHVQRMWTPKTENFRKHRNKKPVVKGVRGRPRIHPLPDPSIVNIKGKPRESYDPEHIKLLLEKKQAKDQVKKNHSGLRGRPTKLEALKLMLEDRRQQASTHMDTDSHTSTKCTTPNQESEDESELEYSPLTFPLAAMVEEIQGSKNIGGIANKENLLFVSSKALCDNRKLKEKLLERNDPVFREMKLKFKQELKNIQKIEVKAKPSPPVNQFRKRRGPRGPYKKKNATSETVSPQREPISQAYKKKNAVPETVSPQREPISQRLIAKREAATATRKLEQPTPELKKPMVRKKIVPTYREQKLPSLVPQKKYVTPSCTIELIPQADPVPDYPSDLDRFMKANNLTYRRDPVPKILISKNPFIGEPSMPQTLVVTKNPFLQQSTKPSAQNNMLMKNKIPKKRGRPRKHIAPIPPPPPPKLNQSNGGSVSVCINLISSDEEEAEDNNALNYTYPTVANEPVGYGYDEESYPYDNEFSLFSENVSISLISDEED